MAPRLSGLGILNLLKATGIVDPEARTEEKGRATSNGPKFAKKVIDACNRIAKAEDVDQRQSYVRVAGQLLREAYNATHPRRAKRARKTRKKLRTIARRLIRELRRELDGERLDSYKNN